MKEYFRYFRFWFIAFAVVFVVWIATVGSKKLVDNNEVIERTNTECTTDERVFDNADVLTDEEEDKLRKQIAETEKKLGIDIVLVTLNESLKEYAREYDPNASYSEFTMIYADNFYDEHKFGYNKPIGDGILLLDNIYKEDNGKIYTWLCTTGKVEDRYSTAMIDNALDVFYEYVESNPYKAYRNFVDQVAEDMSGKTAEPVSMPWYMPFVSAIVATGIFVVINMAGRKGKKTTNQRSYVNGGQPRMRRKEDSFIRKSVTSRTIETSSSSGGGRSGGGGHHRSSSGSSHGGGGRSR